MTIALASIAFAMLIQAGLGGYFIGRLTQRVQHLEKTDMDQHDVLERMVKLEVQMGHVDNGLKQLNRGMEGVQRQIANLMTGKGQIIHFADRE